MDDISDVQVVDCKKSNFLKPLTVTFTQSGKKRAWDALKVHDSVAVLIYNTTRQVFVLVKQFRPAVYLGSSTPSAENSNGVRTIDTSQFPGSQGVTYEMCAGIIDKNKSIAEIAQEEVWEECGYRVPLESFRRVTTFRNGVGTAGSLGSMYYCEVTDDMKQGEGGGCVNEDELIDVVEIPVTEGRQFIMDESKIKPVHLMFGMSWFYMNVYKN